MIVLERFLEPIEMAGDPLGDGYQAYRMDGTSPNRNMRKEAGLGTCNCCDYFTTWGNATILIEETRLVEQYKGLRGEYHYLPDDTRKDFIDKLIRDEKKLKVYGSMLVLCRLVAVSQKAQTLLQEKKYKFWLVVSGMNNREDRRVLDRLRGQLDRDLRSALTGSIVDDVKIVSSDWFTSKLAEHTANS